MERYIQVVTVLDNERKLEEIANAVLKERLGACVQISGPIKSFYWWQGKIENTEEWVMSIKTKRNLYEKLEELIKKLHPYEVPEILSFSIENGYTKYFKWLENEVYKG